MALPHVTLQPGRAVDHAALAQEGAGRAAEGCVVLPREPAARAGAGAGGPEEGPPRAATAFLFAQT
jgi:hypothetical protein